MKFNPLVSTIILSIALGFIGPIYYLVDDSLYRMPSEYFIYSIIDIIITSVSVLFFLRYKIPVDRVKHYLLFLFDSKRFVFFVKFGLLVCIAIIASRFQEISSFLTEGSREELVFDIGLSKSVSFAISFSVIVIALQLSGLDLSRTFKIIPLLVLVSGSVLQLSRSEILFVLFYSMVLFSLSHNYFFVTFRRFYISLILMMTIGYIGLIVNIFQGRAEDLFGAFQNSSLAFTSYRSAALYLGHHFSNIAYSFEYTFYPFFGFIYERMITILFEIDVPLSTNNSDYFYKFISFGSESHQVGNVFYPLNSFYYYQFGYLGILIKAAFCVLLIYASYRFKFYFLFFYICYSILFVAAVKHPLLNADSTYQALFFLVFDFIVRYLVAPAKPLKRIRPVIQS